MSDATIRHVVDAISDGDRIDWTVVRRWLAEHGVAEYGPHLETVSKIGSLTQEDDGPQKTDVREPAWVFPMLGFATAQIALGIAGRIMSGPASVLNVLRLLTVIAFAGTGLVLRHSRHNLRARHLGAVFLLCALGFSRYQYMLLVDRWLSDVTWAAVLRHGIAVDAWAPYFFWQFARRFPTKTRFTAIDRTATVFTVLAAVVGAGLFAASLWVALTHAHAGIAWMFALEPEGQRYYSATIFALTLPVLPLIVLRARSVQPDERRRVRLFAFAMVAGIAPTYIEVILEALFPRYLAFLMSSSGARTAIATGVILPLLALPFITGYSVLVHRLLGVGFTIRQCIRYLLTKWTVAVLTATPFGLLAIDVYTRRNESVVNVVAGGHGLALIALGALGCVLLVSKDAVLALVDRWFDRAQIDRASVLAWSGDALRLVRTRSEFAASIAEAAARALNAPVVVHFFDARRHAYVAFDDGALSLPGDSALATIMMQDPTLSTLAIEDARSIARCLPRGDQAWLRRQHACIVAPIRATGGERPAAAIVFGDRRDALGYSREDERFVTALSSAAGIALENLRLKSEATGEEDDAVFGVLCERCRRVIDAVAGQAACPCGGGLRTASVPRCINGKFLVEAWLGAGGMGVAYLASDQVLRRYVAIKTLPSVSSDAMARLEREARTMAALSHPNLAKIWGYESWRGTPMLVCEYLSGGTLQQRLARERLTVDEAVTLGSTLLDALEYMHAQGVLHRDIKPSNIAFTSDKTPKLLDFGLAGLMEHTAPSDLAGATAATAVLSSRLAGTLAYLPPQAFQGAAPTIQFDLWSLAVVLYEAIVGRHPFAAGDATVDNICRGRTVVALDDGGVPAAVAAVLRQALNPLPDSQFDSCSTMRAALLAARIVEPTRERDDHAH